MTPKTETDRVRLLTLQDTCAVLSISIQTLRRRIEAGELPVIRDGRIIRVHPNDLDRYVAARRSLWSPVTTNDL